MRHPNLYLDESSYFYQSNKFVDEYGFFDFIPTGSSTSSCYALTIDNLIVYIGKTDCISRRAQQHAYGIYTSVLPTIHSTIKYRILAAALLSKDHEVNIYMLARTQGLLGDELDLFEEELIEYCRPPLNIKFRGENQDIHDITLSQALERANFCVQSLPNYIGLGAAYDKVSPREIKPKKPKITEDLSL